MMSQIKNLKGEIWIPICKWKRYYAVSNLGRIKRLKRRSKNSRGKTSFKLYQEKLLSTKNSNLKKYTSMGLTVNGITKYRDLHVLVLESFTPKPFRKAIVNHKNGLKHDNRLKNLEWVTQKENILHAIGLGLCKWSKGEDVGNSKITSKDVKRIVKLRKKGFMYKDICEQLNISKKIIGDICRGRTWIHITGGKVND